MITTINPATNEKIAEYPYLNARELESKLHTASDRSLTWRQTATQERRDLTQALVATLQEEAADAAQQISVEMGKPITESKAEIEKCLKLCAHYTEHLDEYLDGRSIALDDGQKAEVCHEPLGVILGVMPWNFPYWQVFRFAIPTILAGNTIVLKHSNNVAGCAGKMEDFFAKAGFPEGVFTNLYADHDMIEDVIADRRIKGVSLTGSTKAGRAVAAQAAKHLKPSLLELGGSDPYIVLKDADLTLAAQKCVKSRLINSGQSCIAAKRFIIEQAVYVEFVDKVRSLFAKQVIGDPLSTETTIGPLAREDLVTQLTKQVKATLGKGASQITESGKIVGPGNYYPPTILTEVPEDAPARTDELFGPVATIIKASDEQEAVHIANETSFGLGAALFTQDIDKGRFLAQKMINAGGIAINDFVKSDPRVPFGGIGESGYGRELAVEGMRAFVNTKSIVY